MEGEGLGLDCSTGKRKRKEHHCDEPDGDISDEDESGSDESEGDDDDEGGSNDGSDDSEEEGGDSDEDAEEEEDEEEEDDDCGDQPEQSSDDEREGCPICLNGLRDQELGTPENCAHLFCLDCILEWAKNMNSCPVDRKVFTSVSVRACVGGPVLRQVPVQDHLGAAKDGGQEEEPTFCEVCRSSDREDRLLLCDGCDAGYHMECLDPALDTVPVEEWFCPQCRPVRQQTGAGEEGAGPLGVGHRQRRVIARTRQSEIVRTRVNISRITRTQQIRRAVSQVPDTPSVDDAINAVACGASTAIYYRPEGGPQRRKATRRKRRTKRQGRKTTARKTGVKKLLGSSSSTGTAKPGKRRKGRRKKRRFKRQRLKMPRVVTPRMRIARSLHLGKPMHGQSVPSVYRAQDNTPLGMQRMEIGVTALSVFGNVNDFAPEDDSEPEPCSSGSLPAELHAGAKQHGLSKLAMRSHRPVARPIPSQLAGLAEEPCEPAKAAAVPAPGPVEDVLGSILAGQSMLLTSSTGTIINRDGSLLRAKQPAGPPPQQRGTSKTADSTGRTLKVERVKSPTARTVKEDPGPPSQLPGNSAASPHVRRHLPAATGAAARSGGGSAPASNAPQRAPGDVAAAGSVRHAQDPRSPRESTHSAAAQTTARSGHAVGGSTAERAGKRPRLEHPADGGSGHDRVDSSSSSSASLSRDPSRALDPRLQGLACRRAQRGDSFAQSGLANGALPWPGTGSSAKESPAGTDTREHASPGTGPSAAARPQQTEVETHSRSSGSQSSHSSSNSTASNSSSIDVTLINYEQKLQRQKKAEEEAKRALKPFYLSKEISKQEYKDILRKAVHKISHSSAEVIVPSKVDGLVVAYVKNVREARRYSQGPSDG
ncbi:PHD and RING finger domain-containing protein 1-like isoform X1 [Lethenteron reissneri]|uniref:PHD and RING finger domain-containing protein 1-like isoform X1 n=1 Tax=Lethenteron reissneri TaxID=7753 RepID=UPI002AB777C8|nr:PHD and RING finger domain-containing protein 1-like isoform X1 [Lethenteron reissneri]